MKTLPLPRVIVMAIQMGIQFPGRSFMPPPFPLDTFCLGYTK